ncbi:hypothetical protein QPK32_24080 [Massilia sp. YIM B02763]|uniref:hypothetical protein n=1 Tax=Massilia sp. YIM B02763 TaxID=3050130 RepID=UPI0025B6350A|nr:hypothetical protein [Massilia sp. YIM B02763]MDN4056148.1 hypothetical protein [Massilia sp. YIM B02763]
MTDKRLIWHDPETLHGLATEIVETTFIGRQAAKMDFLIDEKLFESGCNLALFRLHIAE